MTDETLFPSGAAYVNLTGRTTAKIFAVDDSTNPPQAGWMTAVANGSGQGLAFRGAWAAATAYTLDDVLTYGGSSYVVTNSFTSGQTFSTANLAVLAVGGAGTSLATTSVAGVVKPDGVSTAVDSSGAISVLGSTIDDLTDASSFTAVQINSGEGLLRISGVDYKITPAAYVGANMVSINSLPANPSPALNANIAISDPVTGAVTRTTVAQLLAQAGGTGPASSTFSITLSAPSVVVGSPVSVTVTPGAGGWPANEVFTPSAPGLTGSFDQASRMGNGTTPVTFTFTPSAPGSGTISGSAPGMSLSGSAPGLTATSAATTNGAVTFSVVTGTPTFTTSGQKFGTGALVGPCKLAATINLASQNFCMELFAKSTALVFNTDVITVSDGTNTIGLGLNSDSRFAALTASGTYAGSGNAPPFDGAYHYVVADHNTSDNNISVNQDGATYQSFTGANFAGSASCTITLTVPSGMTVDALKISNVSKYPTGVSATTPTAAPTRDANTVEIWQFDGDLVAS